MAAKNIERTTQAAVAQRMGETNEQIVRLARTVGLTGISKTAGAQVLEAVLEDLTRNVAVVLTVDNEAYRAFMVAAGFASYGS